MFTKSLLEDFPLLPSQVMFPYFFHYFTYLGRFKYGRRVYQETFPDLRSLRGREKGVGEGGGGKVHFPPNLLNFSPPHHPIFIPFQLQPHSIAQL